MAPGNGTGQLMLQQTHQLQQQQLPAEVQAAAAAAGCIVAGQEHVTQQQYMYSTSHDPSLYHPGIYSTGQGLSTQQNDHQFSKLPPSQATYAQQASDSQLAPLQHQSTGLSSSDTSAMQNTAAAPVAIKDPASMQAGGVESTLWHSSTTQQEQQGVHQGQQMPLSDTLPQSLQQPAATAGQHKRGPAQLTLPGLSPDALTGLLFSPLGLLSPLGGLMMPTSTRPFRLPSFGQITMMRPSLNGTDWDWEALLSADSTHLARGAHGGDNDGAAGTSNKVGTKRPRASFLNAEDDAALLIDMQPAKTARSVDVANPTSLTGYNNSYLRDFLNRFE